MNGIRWNRVLLATLTGGIAWFVLGTARGIFLGLVGSAGGGPGLSAPPDDSYGWLALVSCPFFACLAAWLYASIRPRYGPGPATAARVGLALGLALEFVDLLWATAASASLEYRAWSAATMLILALGATQIAAWTYREDDAVPGAEGGSATDPV